ncbi:MAG: hypothetical protein HFI65_06610 [Lachnospiraceae bacterium]|nr:hypothetical protein [Lachnospiraceae bacterium]
MILVEAQSTWSMNIIVRALLYLSQTYHDYLRRTQMDLYRSKKVPLPEPELYVIYTGERRNRPGVLSLSEEFFGGRDCALEVKVRVIYEGQGTDIISQYVTFTKVYDEQRRLYGETRKAVAETVRICKDRNILKEYLDSREREVVTIMMCLFDEETIMEIHIKNRVKDEVEKVMAETVEKVTAETVEKVTAEVEKKAKKEAEQAARQATKQAAKEAAKQVAKEAAIKMLKTGKLSAEEIAGCLKGLSVEDVRRLEKEMPKNA